MNVQYGFYWERGLAYIAVFTDKEYDALPDISNPQVTLDSDNKTVIIDFEFTKIPFNVFVFDETNEDLEIVFLCYRESDFYCKKIITCKITKNLLMEAYGMQKALELTAKTT